MVDRNRGKASGDDKFFAAASTVVLLEEAVSDLYYLLSRGFAEKSSLLLVANRYKLHARQMKAIQGMAASAAQIDIRKQKEILPNSLNNHTIAIDGFNLLILLEAAMSGSYIFKGLDGCYRDIAGVHGSYKRVKQTTEALSIVADILHNCKVAKVVWYLDKPISNSGMLKKMLLEIAAATNSDWEVELVFNPDRTLAKQSSIVVSSDAWILDNCLRWTNLPKLIFQKSLRDINVIGENFSSKCHI